NKNEGKETGGPALAEEVAGTYSGTFTMSVMGSPAGSENLDCTVSAATDNTVDIVLDQFTAMGSTQFSLSAEGVSVADADGGYSLTGSIDTMSGETHITGSVSGTVGKDGSAEITFEFTPGAMPMSITGVFTSPARNNE
ncbi:MAG: calycin-like domain-containing protein, partial [Bacteroidetes bacterium]|nr:calycin-like domain-containing protein [Candidatus Cryptobacteroides excrementavium]